MSVALVTGATGLVGSHIVERLLADGWMVRALSRRAPGLAPAGPSVDGSETAGAVEVVHGDVLDAASLLRASNGVDTIFHCAASIFSRAGWEGYRGVNVDGTANVIEAASRSRARLLHVSSVAVYGPQARYDALKQGRLTDEETPLPPLPERAYYARSKRDSEQLVLRAHVEGRAWTTAVRPDVVYGRRDRQFVPRMARLIRRGAIPLLNGGRSTLAVVHAANVADGAVLAATSDVAGGRAWNLANDFDVTMRRFFELAGHGLDRSPIFVPMSVGIARGVIRAVRGVLRAIGAKSYNFVSDSTVDFIAENNPFSSERAKRELGWRPTVQHEAGVPDAFRWWAETQRARDRLAPS